MVSFHQYKRFGIKLWWSLSHFYICLLIEIRSICGSHFEISLYSSIMQCFHAIFECMIDQYISNFQAVKIDAHSSIVWLLVIIWIKSLYQIYE